MREVLIDGVPCTMFRISYVGENGWEIYTKMEHGLRLWDTISDAGQEFDIRPVGIGVYAVTGRIEKGYRLMGAELESEYNPVEAGLARPKVKSADFIGKQAYLKARADAESTGPAAIMCTLSMDDQTSAAGIKRYPTGGNEPIVTPDGERIVDAHGPRLADHDRRRRAVARHLPVARLPSARARGRGQQARRGLHERAVPGHRRQGRQPTPVRPRRHPHEDRPGMRILVCVKRVPAPGARISITADGQEVDTSHLAFTTSPHEECAVEAAAQLVEQHGGEATVLTLGPPKPRSNCATRCRSG